MTLPIVRASALSGWPDCPRRGAANIFRSEVEAAGYELRRPPRGIGATVGTAVHAGAAAALRSKAAEGRIYRSGTLQAARESYERQAAEEPIGFDDLTASANAAHAQIVSMVTAYICHVALRIAPILIEKRLEADTGFGLMLSGQTDVVAMEPGEVDDLKTFGKRRGWHKPQLGSYSLLARTHGLEIERANVDSIQRVPVGKEQPAPIRETFDIAECETTAMNVLRHIAGDLRVWRRGDPAHHIGPGDPTAFLANPASYLCSAKYCPAHGTAFCPEGKKTNG